MKSDVWSLGCIIYELCEFKSPFRNENEKMSLMDLFTNITKGIRYLLLYIKPALIKGDYKEINKKYSDELRKTINSMIVVDPTNRAEVKQILQKSEYMLNILKKTPKIDSILVMEDIYEKLQLIDYQVNFVNPLKKVPVSKFFFAISQEPES